MSPTITVPSVVWRESGLLYKTGTNITTIPITIEYAGEKPQVYVTNQQSSTSDGKWEQVTITGSGIETIHTFTGTGTELAYRVVFVRGYTTISSILLTAGGGMADATGYITKDGRKIVLDLAFSSSASRTRASEFVMGEGSTAAAPEDTDLETIRPLYNEESVDDMDDSSSWTPSGTNTLSDNTTTYLRGTGAINLIKSDTSSATASMAKTVTSRDFSSQNLLGFIRVGTTALADLAQVVVRYGSDASNYYEFIIDDSAFTADSFYILDVDSSDADSTTGTPVDASMDYLYVAAVMDAAANTIASGDFIVEEFFLYTSDDNDKPMETNYPLVDLTNICVELRGRINTLQGNGFNFQEAGFKNTDSPKLLFSRYTFDTFLKTQLDEKIISHNIDIVTI